MRHVALVHDIEKFFPLQYISGAFEIDIECTQKKLIPSHLIIFRFRHQQVVSFLSIKLVRYTRPHNPNHILLYDTEYAGRILS